MRGFGKSRLFFKSRAQANLELKNQRKLLETHGREALAMSQREMSDFIHARTTLAKYGETINEAVKSRVDYWENIRRCKLTVGQFKDEYIAKKEALLAREELRPSHVRDMRSRLNRFCQNFGDRQLTEIGFKEIEEWLLGLEAGTQSRRNYHTVISGMFNEAVRLELIETNPLARIAKPEKSETPSEIFTVDELAALLEAAQQIAPDVLPMIALGAFAGVRTDAQDGEIKRLDWSAIDLKRGHIDLSAAVTKRAKRRVVPIQPNLAAWLAPYSAMQGCVVPKGARRKLDKVRKAARVESKNNALRHSYASCRLEATKNAPLVAYELGHPNPTLLYNTYRELVMPKEAERYWNLKPKTTKNVVQYQAA